MVQPDIFSLLSKSENTGSESEAPPSTFSVSQFLDLVNDLLQPLTVTVRGEVSSVNERPTGIYFSITDKEENAKLDCVLWRRNSEYYKSIIKQGAEIDINGNPNIYKPYGKMSFIANHISPVGEGALQAAFEALKRQLEKNGYFSEERKQELPRFIKKVGLVTSEFGDARKDFMTHLGNHGFQIYFHDARVEGSNSIPSITKAIDWFNTNTSDVEVIVLTRGGGSLESLQAFNSLEVAQAIYKSRIPVISAVGHENDVTIADMVADVRASTPTHAGKIIAEDWIMAEQQVELINNSISNRFKTAANEMKHQFEQMQQRILSNFSQALNHKKSHLTMMSSGMIGHYRSIFTRFEKVEQAFEHARSLLQQKTTASKQLLAIMDQKVEISFNTLLQKQLQRLISNEALINAADPSKKLRQGYSMTFTKSGKLIKTIDQLSKNDQIITRLGKGTVESSVDIINTYEKDI